MFSFSPSSRGLRRALSATEWIWTGRRTAAASLMWRRYRGESSLRSTSMRSPASPSRWVAVIYGDGRFHKLLLLVESVWHLQDISRLVVLLETVTVCGERGWPDLQWNRILFIWKMFFLKKEQLWRKIFLTLEKYHHHVVVSVDILRAAYEVYGHWV